MTTNLHSKEENKMDLTTQIRKTIRTYLPNLRHGHPSPEFLQGLEQARYFISMNQNDPSLSSDLELMMDIFLDLAKEYIEDFRG